MGNKRKYKVEFEVEGELLGDDVELDNDEIEGTIMQYFDKEKGNSYFGNRGIDCDVSKLKIEKLR